MQGWLVEAPGNGIHANPTVLSHLPALSPDARLVFTLSLVPRDSTDQPLWQAPVDTDGATMPSWNAIQGMSGHVTEWHSQHPLSL